ncbi:hypothetical protein R3W88_033458 [Solanum pinnatisectum]|uniref:Uncharacterized protein n=1 Tax=Solanum pinnatisectum TaxID=50273 RepID=A0AAV9K1E8_9SOLN|nr:hypothetical protein R3W88_033458 [Solanum pinnatisectum]
MDPREGNSHSPPGQTDIFSSKAQGESAVPLVQPPRYLLKLEEIQYHLPHQFHRYLRKLGTQDLQYLSFLHKRLGSRG